MASPDGETIQGGILFKGGHYRIEKVFFVKFLLDVTISQKRFSCTISDEKNDKKQNERKSWELTVCKWYFQLYFWKINHIIQAVVCTLKTSVKTFWKYNFSWFFPCIYLQCGICRRMITIRILVRKSDGFTDLKQLFYWINMFVGFSLAIVKRH